MGRTRQPRKFSVDEIVGLRVVAEIIRYARLPQNDAEFDLLSPRGNEYIPIRAFAKLISSERKQFQMSQVHRNEAAGTYDKNSKNYLTVSPEYLDAVAPRTPYTSGQLAAIIRGDYKSWSVPPIEKIVAKTVQVSNYAELVEILRKYRISEEEYQDLCAGLINKDAQIALASLLQITEDELLKAAAIQLAERLLPDVEAELSAAPETDTNERSGDLMCRSLTDYYRGILDKHGFDLSKGSDYKRLCKVLGVDANDDVALRLKEIALERDATEQEYLDVAAPIRELEGMSTKEVLDKWRSCTCLS